MSQGWNRRGLLPRGCSIVLRCVSAPCGTQQTYRNRPWPGRRRPHYLLRVLLVGGRPFVLPAASTACVMLVRLGNHQSLYTRDLLHLHNTDCFRYLLFNHK